MKNKHSKTSNKSSRTKECTTSTPHRTTNSIVSKTINWNAIPVNNSTDDKNRLINLNTEVATSNHSNTLSKNQQYTKTNPSSSSSSSRSNSLQTSNYSELGNHSLLNHSNCHSNSLQNNISSSSNLLSSNMSSNYSNSNSTSNNNNKKSKKHSCDKTQTNIEITSNSRRERLKQLHNLEKNHSSSSIVRNILLTVGVSLLVAVCLLSNNSKLLSQLTGNSKYQNNARYIRSINSFSNQDNDISNTNSNNLLTRVINGVTEMYNTHFSPSLQNIMGNLPSNNENMRTADLGNLSKNGKLHYIPSSGFDPSKTAHHVLEGAGYRLNIPTYVQNIPEQQNNEPSGTNMNNNNPLSSNSESVPVQSELTNTNIIQNEDFDQAILSKQVFKPRGGGTYDNTGQITSNSGIKIQNTGLSSTSNKINSINQQVPLSTIDPELDQIVNEMLELKSKNLLTRPDTSSSFNIIKKLNTSEIFNKNKQINECSPKKDIVFAKTHKTGGTTITNMLLRHAEKQNLNVGLPVEYHWELAGYPGQYNKELITPKQDNYNVMCHHMRFDKSEIEKQVSPLADYFTILRDPVSNFESSFGFFKDYPFTSWLDENRSLDDFINNAETLYNKSTPWYFRAKNYMSFDLGFDHENNSKEYIKYAISKMEEDFKFVMITDRYEESMILLKNMLCLDYEDILYLPLKVRTDDDRKKISLETAKKIKNWNRLDTAIYEYFSERFEQMTVEYGKDKLAREVEILKEKLKDVETRCVEDYDSQSLKPWIKRIKLRKPSGQMCQRLVWGEVKYADYLRQNQYTQLSEDDYNNQPKLDDKIKLMQEIQQEILGDVSV